MAVAEQIRSSEKSLFVRGKEGDVSAIQRSWTPEQRARRRDLAMKKQALLARLIGLTDHLNKQ